MGRVLTSFVFTALAIGVDGRGDALLPLVGPHQWRKMHANRTEQSRAYGLALYDNTNRRVYNVGGNGGGLPTVTLVSDYRIGE
jgi:hypothetical protein